MTCAEFRAIFEANKNAIYAFAWRMTGSPATAEDIAQDCFLLLLQSPAQYDEARGSVRAWLLGVARNLILKRWRSEGRWTTFDHEDFPVEPLLTDCRVEEIVSQAVQALPPLQREVLVLVEYEGMTLEETAGAVASAVGTVKARLHRARSNLRRILEPLRSTIND